ncbi:hypothetical protein [Streptacidiphilus melanogenes]|uniref:hypothetical protein n=1 Tax=Streptacidiphilus melanogenes TaxID=411235 RepID=UPI0005A687BD|nr:hypothetical protein [Streptacidiphilus melanogenes]
MSPLVKGRVLADGRTELLEVNARPGGRIYRAAMLHSCGVDPFWEAIMMALDDGYTTNCEGIAQSASPVFGMRPFEIQEIGRVAESVTLGEWERIDGVDFGYVHEGFVVTSLAKENVFGEVLLTASNLAELREVEARVEQRFHARVEPFAT